MNNDAEAGGREQSGGLMLRLRALRAFSFSLSAGPVLVTWAAVHPRGRSGPGMLLACVAGAVLLHAAGNLFNDYFDDFYGVDRRATGDANRPGRLLVHDRLAPATFLRMAVLAVALSVLPATYIWTRAGPRPVLFAMLGLLLAYAYTGPPFRLKHRAMGEPVVFLAFGPLLMAGAALALTGGWSPEVAWLSLPVGAAVMAVLVGDNLRDLQEDSEAGIHTLVMVLGVRWSRRLYVLLVVGSAVGAGLLAAFGVIPLVGVAVPLSLAAARGPLRRTMAGERVPNIDALTAGYASALMLLLILACLFGG